MICDVCLQKVHKLKWKDGISRCVECEKFNVFRIHDAFFIEAGPDSSDPHFNDLVGLILDRLMKGMVIR